MLAVCALVAGPASAISAEPLTAKSLEHRYDAEIKPLLTNYCGDCHFDGPDKGDVRLDSFASLASVQDARVTWQKVADNVVTHSMPPAKRKTQPSDDERKRLGAWVREALEFVDFTGPRDPGRVTVRRLNRVEYNNTIRDLLGIADFQPAADFPADDSGYGFDNIGDVLTTSPLLMEKYLAAAESALDKAIVTDTLPWTILKIDGAKLDGDGERTGHRERRTLATNGEAYTTALVPIDASYKIRIRAAGDQGGDQPVRMTLRVDDRGIETFDVTATRRNAKVYEAEVKLKAGPRRIGVAFINDFWDEKLPDGERDRNLHVEEVEVVGPVDGTVPPPTETQRKLLFTTSGDDAAAQVLERFAARAYRRPVSSEEVARLVALFAGARADGDTFEKAMKLAMSAVLVSPNFLFRVEREQSADPDKPYNITDHELATRLGFFLWSSMPDDALTAAAASGKLREPAVLAAQVKRMLADPKAAAFVENFVGQWLVMRNLEHHSVDRERNKDFTEKLRGDMAREVELFFANLVVEDRSVLELLDSDYTFVNERLAKLYGIQGVKGDDEFRRVSLAGTPRGGVTTMAGVLTVTAMPGRTSPVKRGKFVLEQLFGSPPPPAPANVTPLSERRDEQKKGSVRQRFEAHRSDATCVACHARMDPIGFAMENFDAIGRWRDTDNGFAIDAAGALPEGEKFTGPTELRKVLMGRKDEFVRALTEKMLTYALGRGMQNADRRTVREIADAVAKDGYRFSALVNGIVTSDAFQKRRAKRPGE
jgi:hypothetical protein